MAEIGPEFAQRAGDSDAADAFVGVSALLLAYGALERGEVDLVDHGARR